jgi:hypothetical protein
METQRHRLRSYGENFWPVLIQPPFPSLTFRDLVVVIDQLSQ